MLKITLSAFAAAVLLAFGLSPNAAQAQSRVFVAAQGSDANSCTFAQPCRTFQHAHDVVAANGEIDVLDPAGYGALTITKSISIQGHGFAGISASSGNAITVNVGTINGVNLRGLLLDGVAAGGLNGIKVDAAVSLNVQDCLIRSFVAGISIAPSGSTRVSVSNTVVSMSPNSNIQIEPTGSGTVNVVLDHVELEHSSNFGGLLVNGNSSTGSIQVTLSNSVVAHDLQDGVDVLSISAATAVFIQNSTIADNAGVAVLANGSASPTVRMTHSSITGNVLGLVTVGSGSIVSFGDNSIAGNGGDGAPTSTITLK